VFVVASSVLRTNLHRGHVGIALAPIQSNEAVLQEIADWNKKVDELGIVLDSDPRKIAINGQLQMAADASSAEAQGSDTGVKKPKTNEKLNGKANGAGSHPH